MNTFIKFFITMFLSVVCGFASASTYTVVKDDTLSHIAVKHGLSLAVVAEANPQIKNLHRIFPGQVVKVPAEAQQSVAQLDNTLQIAIKKQAAKVALIAPVIVAKKPKATHVATVTDAPASLEAVVANANCTHNCVLQAVLSEGYGAYSPEVVTSLLKEIVADRGQWINVQEGTQIDALTGYNRMQKGILATKKNDLVGQGRMYSVKVGDVTHSVIIPNVEAPQVVAESPRDSAPAHASTQVPEAQTVATTPETEVDAVV